jgi:hypothetical protein
MGGEATGNGSSRHLWQEMLSRVYISTAKPWDQGPRLALPLRARLYYNSSA